MSVAGAGGAPADAAEGGAGQGQQAAAGIPEGFAERFEQFASGFEGLPDRLSAIEQQLQAPAEPERQQEARTPDARYLLDPETGYYLDRLTNQWVEEPPGGDYGPELTAEAVEQMVQEGIQRGLEPYARQQMLAGMAALEEQYPELRDPEIVQEVKAEVQRVIAESMPNADAEAWKNPTLIEKIYLARAAGERAEQEDPATGEPSTTLEDPAASTAVTKELEDEGDAIVKAGQKGAFFK